MSASVVAAGQTTVLGIFLAIVLVGGFVAVGALWYFMVYRASNDKGGK
jgi:Flp pilus assembly protein protease CpaA